MVRSLVVILLPVLALTVLLTRNIGDHPVQVVDYQPALDTARREAPFPVLAPRNLPASWRPTIAQWVRKGQPYLNDEASVRNRWQLGFLSPKNVYVAVLQADAVPKPFVDEVSRGGVPDGSSRVGGQAWERLVSADQRTRSLVRQGPTATAVVVGDAPYEVLEAFASTLSPS